MSANRQSSAADFPAPAVAAGPQPELVRLKSGLTILDTDDQIRLIKQVIEAEGLDKDRWPARQLAALIDSWKNRGLTPDKLPRGEAFGFGEGKGAALYGAYQK